MSRVVKLSISGHAAETDAPSVEDALDQLRDYLDILRGVEDAVSGDESAAIIWRIVSASRKSPLTFSIEAFPKQYATNIDARAGQVVSATAQGLAMLEKSGSRPPFFTDEVLRRTHRVFGRLTNGIASSEADFGEGLPKSVLTQSVGKIGEKNVSLILDPIEKPFQAIGSVEGYLQAAGLDGHGRRIVQMKARITGQTVKCVLAPTVRADLGQRQISELFSHRRILASGRIHYKSLTKIGFIDTTSLRFLRPRSELPQLDDIIDPDFTGGLKSEDFLEKVYNG